MRRTVRQLTLAAVILVAGCAPIIVASEPEPGRGEGRGNSNAARLGIPPGHLPPPGQCRVWYPGRPPGRQPRPVACGEAMRTAPLGAWVLYRAKGEEVHRRVMDPRRAGIVVEILVFESASGRYLRQERP